MPVAPELLNWAVERSGREPEALAKRFPKLNAWLQAQSTPTLKQLQHFADATYTPFGSFFLPAAPDEPLPIPDFRSGQAAHTHRPSGNLLDTIYLCQTRQTWFRDFAGEEGIAPVALIGSVTRQTPIEIAARSIREAIHFDLDRRREAGSWAEALSLLIRGAEEAGILVMVSGVVGNNTRRKLDPDEFRGFALADAIAPLIFVNGADSKSGQMFTLAHELAHLALGQSALSDTEASVFPDRNIERWCDQVAAELLVPMDDFRRDLRPGEPLRESTSRLARRFKVSTLVILRRLFEAGAIANREAFWRAYRAENDRLREIAPAGATGGDFYRTLGARVSHRFEYALVSSALGGRTPFTEAFRMLGCKRMATFDNLAHRLGFTA